MVVGCPKCKIRLKIADEKIKPEGSRFKCPKCATLLLIRKPAAKPAPRPTTVTTKNAVVAHERAETVHTLRTLLMGAGYTVFTATDGVSAMMKAMKIKPLLAVLDIALPRIHGLEVSRRLKARADTKDMKTILVCSKGEPRRTARHPVSPQTVDDYIYEDELGARLIGKIKNVLATQVEPKPKPAPTPPPVRKPLAPAAAGKDPDIERARRLARTILSDIELYSPDKVAKAVQEGNFQTVFSEELNEGLKLYNKRIPDIVREKGDFFEEAMSNFIQIKRDALGL